MRFRKGDETKIEMKDIHQNQETLGKTVRVGRSLAGVQVNRSSGKQSNARKAAFVLHNIQLVNRGVFIPC